MKKHCWATHLLAELCEVGGKDGGRHSAIYKEEHQLDTGPENNSSEPAPHRQKTCNKVAHDIALVVLLDSRAVPGCRLNAKSPSAANGGRAGNAASQSGTLSSKGSHSDNRQLTNGTEKNDPKRAGASQKYPARPVGVCFALHWSTAYMLLRKCDVSFILNSRSDMRNTSSSTIVACTL